MKTLTIWIVSRVGEVLISSILMMTWAFLRPYPKIWGGFTNSPSIAFGAALYFLLISGYILTSAVATKYIRNLGFQNFLFLIEIPFLLQFLIFSWVMKLSIDTTIISLTIGLVSVGLANYFVIFLASKYGPTNSRLILRD